MMRHLCTAFVLLAHSTPLAAQGDVEFSPAAIEACLGNNGGTACVGLGAATCTPGEAAGTNLGYGLCFGAELEWWDIELNTAYNNLIAHFGETDVELDQLGSAAPRVVPALRTAQRAWIVWRDAACEYEAAQWGGGSGTGIAQTECVMRLTAEHVIRLQAELSDFDG